MHGPFEKKTSPRALPVEERQAVLDVLHEPRFEDLAPAERRLRMFLEQYFGGPTTYSQERGHPRLRMRHVPFAVTLDMRDRWLRHMYDAMERVDLPPEQAEQMRDYFFRAAHSLVNSDDTPPAAGSSPIH